MKWWNKLLAFAAFTGAVVFVVEVRNMKGDSCCAGGVCALPVPQEKEAPAEVAMAERSLPKLVDLGAGKCVLIDVTSAITFCRVMRQQRALPSVSILPRLCGSIRLLGIQARCLLP